MIFIEYLIFSNKSNEKLKSSNSKLKSKAAKMQIDKRSSTNQSLLKSSQNNDSSIEKLAQAIQIERELISDSLSETERFDIDERNPQEKLSVPNKTSLIASNFNSSGSKREKKNN